METDVPRTEALHNNHQWFAELQPAHDRAQSWIRVFRLEPGAFGDPIYGRLTVEELNRAKRFDALSYSCGPPVLGRTITVNNTPGFRITQNLWNALQRVRMQDGERRLWVDAICIDQEDEREKSSQVRHMHAVYSRAREVCVYFGECTEFTRASTREIGCRNNGPPVEDDKVLSIAGCTPAVHKEFVLEFVDALEADLLNDLGYDASLQLWWKRLWTVQELLLAKHPVVYYGPYVMLWTTVTQIWNETDPRDSLRACYKMRNDINYLEMLRCHPNRDLHALLSATADKCFTEPKDRIFALLGALPQGIISLDYSLDVQVIHTLITLHCIATQGAFDILFSQWDRRYQLDREMDKLYSCVPDFDRSIRMLTLSKLWTIPCLARLEHGRWEGARVGTVPEFTSHRYPFQCKTRGCPC
jgi:hypothetical protein